MVMKNLQLSIFELIKKTSTELPKDVLASLKAFTFSERNELAGKCLKSILENNEMAGKNALPICQDTGNMYFRVICPNKFDYLGVEEAIEAAIVQATELGILRKNSVDPLTNINSGTNIGPGMPQIKFEISSGNFFAIYLILKGGGCENVSRQYSLMRNKSATETNLEAIEKYILEAVQKAQGYGCSPGVLGVCIGGDRETGYSSAKMQFFRRLDDRNEDSYLADLEDDILRKANSLNIGPMGMGGDTTLLAVKIGKLNRIPASMFVTISYMCWAFRRQAAELNADFSIKSFLY